LSLESARSIIGDGPACDRVAAAVGELDQTIQDIRTAVFSQPRSSSREDRRPGPDAQGPLQACRDRADYLSPVFAARTT
jgi:hypothetical protein